MTHDHHTLSSPPQNFYSNSFTGRMPTELGNLEQMKSHMVWPPFIIRSCAILFAIHARGLYEL